MSNKNNKECEVIEANIDVFSSVSKEILEKAVENLVKGLSEGNFELIETGLSSLGVSKEKDIYEQVGGMTRALHDALEDFKDNLSADSITMHDTNLPDATDKLEQVIEMTKESANKILTLCEKTTNTLDENEKYIKEKLESKDISKDFRDFLEKQELWLNQYSENNTAMLMSQTFQDLAGQALKKVIKLVTQVENNLMSILKVFGGTEEIKTVEESENTQVVADVDQSEADALLKSFGF